MIRLTNLLKQLRFSIGVLVFLGFVFYGSVSVAAQGLGGVYSDTWIDTPTEDFDELAPNPPVVVSYSVGEVDPSAPDQTISVQISLVSENGRTVTVVSKGGDCEKG